MASRWLFRLKAVLQLSGLSCEEAYTINLDKPTHRPTALQPPCPCPSTQDRPKKLSVTEIDTLQQNSYNIYAKHVLHLYPLQELDDPHIEAKYGTAIHEALKRWYQQPYKNRTEKDLRTYIQQELEAQSLTPDKLILQKPRLEKIIKWLVQQNEETTSFTEKSGQISWTMPTERKFTLTTRIDRIDMDAQGQATIIDYKTGATCPTASAVQKQKATQLPLEAIILSKGGVPNLTPSAIDNLSYWHLNGKEAGGKIISLSQENIPALLQDTWQVTQDLIHAYETRPYTVSQPNKKYNDYAYLARIQEWNVPTGLEDDTQDDD